MLSLRFALTIALVSPPPQKKTERDSKGERGARARSQLVFCLFLNAHGILRDALFAPARRGGQQRERASGDRADDSRVEKAKALRKLGSTEKNQPWLINARPRPSPPLLTETASPCPFRARRSRSTLRSGHRVRIGASEKGSDWGPKGMRAELTAPVQRRPLLLTAL